MLKTACTNPVILSALSKGGHGDKVLIVSGNYPVDKMCPGVPTAYVGLRAGLPDTLDVLRLVEELIVAEKAEVMLGPDAAYAEIFPRYSELLHGMELHTLPKKEFYAAGGDQRVCLVISTGDIRPWANILLTIGVVRP